MTREEAIKDYIMPALKRTWRDDRCIEIISAIEQEPCKMTAEEYRQRMIQAFHNADTDELIAVCVLPTEKEFEHLEWLLKNHYKKTSCVDAISRQAVLDAIDVKAWEFCDYLISKNRNDEQKPVSHFADTLRECVREELSSVNPQPSGDLISRQSAIFLASDLKQDLPDDEHLTDMVMAHNEGVSEYQTQLSLLPSVNPQNCDTCEVGNPCLYCKHEFEERSGEE